MVDERLVDIRFVGVWLVEVCLLDEWLVDMWLEDVLVLGVDGEVLVKVLWVPMLDLDFVQGFLVADGLGWNSCLRQAHACKIFGSQSFGMKQDSTYPR